MMIHLQSKTIDTTIVVVLQCETVQENLQENMSVLCLPCLLIPTCDCFQRKLVGTTLERLGGNQLELVSQLGLINDVQIERFVNFIISKKHRAKMLCLPCLPTSTRLLSTDRLLNIIRNTSAILHFKIISN